MEYKYGTLTEEQVQGQKEKLTNSIFRLLPMRDQNYKYLDKYFSNLLFRINGMNKLWGEKDPEFITLMSLLEGARYEMDKEKYRTAVLDACALVKKIRYYDKAGEEDV